MDDYGAVDILLAKDSDADAESYPLGVNSYLVQPVNFSTFMDVAARAGLYWAVMNRLPN